MKFKKISVVLLLIVIFAFALRVYKVSVIPPALSWDEVSIGYNAYSIFKTGKDEHGRLFPLDAFAAYGDYKPPFSIYLTVPFVALFGLNELAVRLPSVLFGTLTVLLTYFLVKELLNNGHQTMSSGREYVTGDNEQGTEIQNGRQNTLSHAHCHMSILNAHCSLSPVTYLPLLSSALLAISPWHINLSRAGFEANIALFFIVLGVILVLKAIDRPKLWIVAWIPFIAALYTFNSSRYFAPLLGLGLVFIGRKSIMKNFRFFIIGICLSVVLMLPIATHLVSKEARLRFTEVNIFSDASVVLLSNKRIEDAGGAWWAKIVYNRRVGYARSYVLHYFDHFQPDYLFVKGDGNPKFSIQDVGQLYMIEAPFLVIGAFGLIRLSPTVGLFLLYWLCMAIVPAAVARETPHALRTLNSLPTWQIFVAFGILSVIRWIQNREQIAENNMQVTRDNEPAPTRIYSDRGEQGTTDNRQKIINNKQNCFLSFAHCHMSTVFCFLLSVIYIFSVGYYLSNYYVHYPWMYSGEWQYGYKQALAYVHPIEASYDTIYMTESIGRPYMYTLFYNQIDPKEYLRIKDASFDAAGFYHVYGFGKYRFVKDMPQVCSGRCLFIAPSNATPKDAKILKTIPLLNGLPILTIYE